MKSLKHFARLCSTVVLLVLLAVSLAYSAPLIRQDMQKSNVTQKPGTSITIPAGAAQRLGGGNDGSIISNVKVAPQGEPYTGTVAYVSWNWPGHEKDPVDILIPGVTKITATPWTQGSPYAFNIPYTLDQRDYSVTVRSTNNPSIQANGKLSVLSSYILATSQPVKDSYNLQGSPLRIEWTYKGNPGPVKLELYRTYNSTPITTITPKYGPGNYGVGSFLWPAIPSNIADGRYYVAITSVASGRITADSQQFNIGKAPAPVLLKLDTQAVAQGANLTVTTDNFRDVALWTAVVELQNGEKFEQPITTITPTQFRIKAPAIYAKFINAPNSSEQLKLIGQPKSLYLKKGNVISNKLSFNIIYFPPILEKLSSNTVYPGQKIEISGGNWNKDLIYIPAQHKIILELPGASVTTFPAPPSGGSPYTPVPFFPTYTVNGKFAVGIPQVFCTTSKSVQNAIQNGTGKISLLSTMFGLSNKLDIKIRKTPIAAANPYKLPLAATYNSNAPNRTWYYKGNSIFGAKDCQKAIVTGVRNSSQYPFKLSYKPSGSNNTTSWIPLAPGQTTTAFNNMNAEGFWEAHEGPESGSFFGKYPSVGIDIMWRAE